MAMKKYQEAGFIEPTLVHAEAPLFKHHGFSFKTERGSNIIDTLKNQNQSCFSIVEI